MRHALFALLLVACGPTAVTDPTRSPAPSVAPTEISATVPPSRVAPEASGCPVTLPATSWVPELARFTPLPASRFAWYGDARALAVDLPIDGVYVIGADSPTLDTKIAWVRYIPGVVSITARRVDGTGAEIRTETAQGYGENGFNPSGINSDRMCNGRAGAMRFDGMSHSRPAVSAASP